MNVYPFIEAEKAGDHNVKRACELLEVSRAAYYAQRTDQSSARGREDAELTEQITDLHTKSKGRYGAPRIHAELRRKGKRHGKKRVARLMQQAGLRGRTPKRWKKTTIPDPAAAARGDLIRRDFTVDAAAINSRWCGDITYVPTWEGWLYLATVIDISSRRVVNAVEARDRRRHARPPPTPLRRAQPRRRLLPAPRPPRQERSTPSHRDRHPPTATVTTAQGGEFR